MRLDRRGSIGQDRGSAQRFIQPRACARLSRHISVNLSALLVRQHAQSIEGKKLFETLVHLVFESLSPQRLA